MKHVISLQDVTIGDLIELAPFQRWCFKIRDDYSKKSRFFETGGGWFLVIEKDPWPFTSHLACTDKIFNAINIHTRIWEQLRLNEVIESNDPQIINHVKGE